MKKSILFICIITITCLIARGQTVANGKKDPIGSWKFEAPYAPEGYSSGKLSIVLAEDKYKMKMTFTGSEYPFPGENVRLKNDSLFFSINVEGEIVNIGLKITEPGKMSGSAIYSQGTVPLACIREEEGQVN